MSVFRSLLMKRVGGGQEYEGYPLIIPSTTAGSLLTYEIYGKSLQLTTPTPSAPVDVWGTGEKTINIFDLSQAVVGDISSSTGQVSYNTRRFVSDYIPVAENDVIYFNGTIANTDGDEHDVKMFKAYYDSSQAFITGSRATVTSGFTIPSGVGYVRLCGYNSSMTGNIDLSATKVNITKNVSVPSTYLPYKAITVASGGDCGVTHLGGRTYGRFGTYGVFYSTVSGKEPGATNLFIPGYTVYNGSYTTMPDKSVTAATDSGRIYIKDTDYTVATTFSDAMQGRYCYYQRTTDESWTAPTTTMIEIPDPLHRIEDYTDVLNSNGTITRNVGVKVLDGTESWQSYTYQGSPVSFYLIFSDMIDTTASTSGNNFYNTHLTFAQGLWGSSDIGFACSTMKRMFMRRNTTDTLETWTAWLAAQYAAGTPVIIYYPLETPTTESFTATNIPTQDVTTKITVGNAPGASNIKATY